MGKYNEIMNRIELTPEAKERILSNLSGVSSDAPEQTVSRTRKAAPVWKRALPVAAMLTVVLFGAFMARHFGEIADIGEDPVPHGDPPPVATAETSSYQTPGELETAAGFPVEELRELPFAAETVSYDLTDGIAVMTYTGEGKTAILRKAGEEKTLSNAVCAVIREVEAGEIRAVIGGENERFVLAVWKHGGYSYCLELSEGVPEEKIIGIIGQIAADAASG